MFESRDKLRRDVAEMLESLRELGTGRYAAVFDSGTLVAESPAEPPESVWDLRELVRARGKALLGVPAALHGGESQEDLFEPWEDDEFWLAVVNGRVGVLVAGADAARLEAEAGRLVRVLVDRLLRLEPSWRYDEKGRGLFFGSPRLDTVVIPRPGGRGD